MTVRPRPTVVLSSSSGEYVVGSPLSSVTNGNGTTSGGEGAPGASAAGRGTGRGMLGDSGARCTIGMAVALVPLTIAAGRLLSSIIGGPVGGATGTSMVDAVGALRPLGRRLRANSRVAATGASATISWLATSIVGLSVADVPLDDPYLAPFEVGSSAAIGGTSLRFGMPSTKSGATTSGRVAVGRLLDFARVDGLEALSSFSARGSAVSLTRCTRGAGRGARCLGAAGCPPLGASRRSLELTLESVETVSGQTVARRGCQAPSMPVRWHVLPRHRRPP